MKALTFKSIQTINVYLKFVLSVFVLFVAVSNAFAQAKVIEKQDPKNYKVGFTYAIPKHLPITVEVRNLDKDDWLSEFEIEVTNTGEKPIYFLSFVLILPDSKDSSGIPTGFPLRYGRSELYVYENKVNSEDIPLKMGESFILKVSEKSVKNWKKAKNSFNMQESKVIQLFFQMLRFGDGSGFQDQTGKYLPPLSVSAVPLDRQTFKENVPKTNVDILLGKQTKQAAGCGLPFFEYKSILNENLQLNSLFCCSGGAGCFYVKPGFILCNVCENQPVEYYETGGSVWCNKYLSKSFAP
jgi:hypothetical protein